MVSPRIALALTALSAVALASQVVACSAEETRDAEFRSVQPVCVEEAPESPVWLCDETLSVACEDLDDDLELTVVLGAGECGVADLVAWEGPFAPGEHNVLIENAANDQLVCSAQLIVVDEVAPIVDVQAVQLWPPNHKYRTVGLEDCIVDIDDCEDDDVIDARIVSVSSDEPENDRGDGNTEADIVPVDATHVSLRSERQGGSNGRVYTIDFELEDTSGNVAEAQCHVVVAHDQSGAAGIDDGPAYVVEWD